MIAVMLFARWSHYCHTFFLAEHNGTLFMYIVLPSPGKVSVIKVHPHTHDFDALRTGTFSSDDNKCKLGGVKRFERAILLIRNPFDSIWSEYQRRVSQSHVAGVPKKTFNWHRWQANAANLAHKYNEVNIM